MEGSPWLPPARTSRAEVLALRLQSLALEAVQPEWGPTHSLSNWLGSSFFKALSFSSVSVCKVVIIKIGGF